MKLKTTVLGLGIGALLLTGCGGESEALKATGKLTQESANEIQNAVFMTGLDPEEMLLQMGSEQGATKASLPMRGSDAVSVQGPSNEEWTWEGTHECGFEGNYTNRIISGVSPYDHESDVNASKLVYEYIADGCRYYEEGVKRTGTRKRTWDWKRDIEGRTFANNWSGSTKNFVYELDETHKFTVTSATWSGTNIQIKKEDIWQTVSESYTKHYVRDGMLLDGDTTIEFKKITRDKSGKYDMRDETWDRKWEISGGVKSEDLEGWIIIDTPVALERNNTDAVTSGEISTYCNHAGKVTISGIDHTMTTEFHDDHSIDVKYDDNVTEYENCIDYRRGH